MKLGMNLIGRRIAFSPVLRRLAQNRQPAPEPIVFAPPVDEALKEEYTSTQLSRNRRPVFWGGLFDTRRGVTSEAPRYGSPPGYKYATCYASLPKMRLFGDNENIPELWIVVAGQPGRRMGKNVFVDHSIANYTLLDRVRFPVFYLSKGDEIHMREGINKNTNKAMIDEWEHYWRNKETGRTEYMPLHLPNVEALGPPYKAGDILDECDRTFYIAPSDCSQELLLSMTMLGGGGSADLTAQPKYMKLATDVERLIRDQGAGKQECIDFIEAWNEAHPDANDVRAGKKLRGAINDLFGDDHKEGVLKMDAPTIEEMIKRRRNGYPYVYVINMRNFEQGDRYFGEHIVASIIRANTKNVNEMLRGRYVPPVVVIDEAHIYTPNTGERVYPNKIVEYITTYGYCSGPTVLIGQSKSQFDTRLIDSDGSGMWTHLVELFPGHRAIYTSKLEVATVIPVNQDGVITFKRMEDMTQDEVDKYLRRPRYYSIMGYVKPPVTYIPT